MTHFDFHFAPRYRLPAAAFGIIPSRTGVDVDDDLVVRFGLWTVRTPLGNVTGCTETGPYSFLKTAGPAHLSFVDHGLTCATNGDRGLCISFAAPVGGIEPTGRILHPAVTVTVADIDGLKAALSVR